MDHEEEIEALLYYLEFKNPGSIIRDIIYQRIALLELKGDTHQPRRIANSKACVHLATGKIYHSILWAAKDFRIPYTTLKEDIMYNRGKFGIQLI